MNSNEIIQILKSHQQFVETKSGSETNAVTASDYDSVAKSICQQIRTVVIKPTENVQYTAVDFYCWTQRNKYNDALNRLSPNKLFEYYLTTLKQ